MCMVSWIATKKMTWHSIGKMPIGNMSHPVDSNTWKHIDDMYKDFLVEPQNMSYSF